MNILTPQKLPDILYNKHIYIKSQVVAHNTELIHCQVVISPPSINDMLAKYQAMRDQSCACPNILPSNLSPSPSP